MFPTFVAVHTPSYRSNLSSRIVRGVFHRALDVVEGLAESETTIMSITGPVTSTPNLASVSATSSPTSFPYLHPIFSKKTHSMAFALET